MSASKFMMAIVAATALTALLGAISCGPAGYLGYLLAPEPAAKTVPAEFSDLAKRRVAIVIFADERVQYEYPYARLTLGSVMRSEMLAHVKGATVTDPMKVCRYQDEHTNWETLAKSELAKAFNVDYVLYVSLVEYTTREPGSIRLYRGRITAECAVYKAEMPDAQGKVWRCDPITVTYPKGDPAGVPDDNDRAVREATERLLAQALVRKFYEHKVAPER